MNIGGVTRIECLRKDNYDTSKLQMEVLLVKNDVVDVMWLRVKTTDYK